MELNEVTVSKDEESEKSKETNRPKVLKIALLVICLLPTFYLLFSGKFIGAIKQSSNVSKEVDYSNQFISTLTAHKSDSSNIVFYTDTQETWNTASSAVTLVLNILPKRIKEGFSSDGWRVGIIDKTTEEQKVILNELVKLGSGDGNLGYFKGITVPASKVLIVYLTNENKAYTEEDFKRVLLHEFGHYFEYAIIKPEGKKYWLKYYKQASTVERWVAVDSSECLAEIFADILLDDRARYSDKEAPAYDYMRGLIYSIRG